MMLTKFYALRVYLVLFIYTEGKCITISNIEDKQQEMFGKKSLQEMLPMKYKGYGMEHKF